MERMERQQAAHHRPSPEMAQTGRTDYLLSAEDSEAEDVDLSPALAGNRRVQVKKISFDVMPFSRD
jgi:hypothetical protein